MNHLNYPAPMARTIEATCDHYGWSRTYVYEQLALGRLEARKAGRRTTIVSATADQLFASLPAATFQKPRQKVAA